MALNLETMFNEIQQQGLNSAKTGTLSGVLAFTGANTHTGAETHTGIETHTGAETHSGAEVFSGATSITSKTTNSALVGATVVLTTSQSGQAFINIATSGSPSWTLPASAASGINFTFICGNTTAGFTVTSASQVIHFKTSASGTVLTSTTTLTNTQATAIVGDFISIISDGTAWWMTGISGIFAAS